MSRIWIHRKMTVCNSSILRQTGNLWHQSRPACRNHWLYTKAPWGTVKNSIPGLLTSGHSHNPSTVFNEYMPSLLQELQAWTARRTTLDRTSCLHLSYMMGYSTKGNTRMGVHHMHCLFRVLILTNIYQVFVMEEEAIHQAGPLDSVTLKVPYQALNRLGPRYMTGCLLAKMAACPMCAP